jgi:hypothetical protein
MHSGPTSKQWQAHKWLIVLPSGSSSSSLDHMLPQWSTYSAPKKKVYLNNLEQNNEMGSLVCCCFWNYSLMKMFT